MIKIPVVKNKNVAVLGFGKAGLSAVKALSKSGAHVFAWDDGEKSRAALAAENLKNVTIAEPSTYNWGGMFLLVMSPGIPLTHPTPHPIVKMAKHCPILNCYTAQKNRLSLLV